MGKIDPQFAHDIFKFLHRPIRIIDQKQGNNFVERFLTGPQNIFEDIQKKIEEIKTILDPATTRADLLQFLKDQVGFTRELNNITQDLTENDLRKLIALAVALWKQLGTEQGYENIVRLFTGKSVRIFNFFDFRMIVGEAAFGEEQLGEDSWFISVPGVEQQQDTVNDVIDLLSFENNVKDSSFFRNNALITGDVFFFNNPASGFPLGSTKHIKFNGGVVSQNHSAVYDFVGDLTIEMFIRTTVLQSSKTLFHKVDGSGKGVKIEFDSSTNTINFEINDGSVSVTGSLTPAANIDDGVPRHLALVMDRANGVRLYYGGTESTGLIALGGLGDPSNTQKIVIGGSGVITGNYLGDMDNFRIATNPVYDVTSGTLTPRIAGFIEFIEGQLDEFFSDIRIVDEGDLNKNLMLRILNLMRPSSERLNVIFIRFFDDFIEGSGRFEIISGSAIVNLENEFELSPNTIVATDVLGDADFKDIVLQVKANDTDPAGGIFSVLFFFQDALNFYEYRINTITASVSLHKTVVGVSSQIGATTSFDIVPEASYIFTVTTTFNPLTNDTLLKTFVDSNVIHKVIDSSFEKGRFGMKTDATTTMQTGEIEMFQLPLDVRQVLPGFSL